MKNVAISLLMLSFSSAAAIAACPDNDYIEDGKTPVKSNRIYETIMSAKVSGLPYDLDEKEDISKTFKLTSFSLPSNFDSYTSRGTLGPINLDRTIDSLSPYMSLMNMEFKSIGHIEITFVSQDPEGDKKGEITYVFEDNKIINVNTFASPGCFEEPTLMTETISFIPKKVTVLYSNGKGKSSVELYP